MANQPPAITDKLNAGDTASTGTGDNITNWTFDGSQWVEDTGNAQFDIDNFDKLLGRLEGSKKRQQRQRSVEGRRDIYAQGLAGMMSNF